MNRKKKQLPDKKGNGKDLTYKLMQCLNKQISTKYMTLMITPNSFAVLKWFQYFIKVQVLAGNCLETAAALASP